MAATKLTDQRCKHLQPPDKGRADYWDSGVSGLVLRVTEKGTKTWALQYRVRGCKQGKPTAKGEPTAKNRRMTLGRYPDLGVAKAREMARDALALARKGRDPALEERREAEQTAEQEATTFRRVADDFLRLYRQKYNSHQTATEAAATLQNHVYPALGDKPLTEIRRRDVMRLLDELAAGPRPHAANKALKEIRGVFSWAMERELADANPVAGAGLRVPEPSRDRVLSDAETRALWRATGAMGYPFGELYRLLLLTGQRRDEAALATWDHFDLDAAVWTVPAELSKSGRAHRVPLAPAAVDLLANLPRFAGGPYVFTTTAGRRPVSGFSRAKARADKLLKQELGEAPAPWRVHDLRRTAASGMAALRVPSEVLSRVLNHQPASTEGVTAIYNRHGYEAEKRTALEAWTDHLLVMVGERTADDNVVALHG